MAQNRQELLALWLKRCGLKRKEAARFLAVSASKLSEYLNGKRKVPSYIHAHLITLQALTDKNLADLIEQRLGE